MKQTMWKKALALALSAATMFSTAVPTFAGTEAPASSSSEEESVESTDGTFLVQLKSRGGSVLLQDDTGKQTISLDDDGNLMVSGAEGTAYADLDSEGYATLSYGIGTSVTVTAKSDDGYSVADYALTTADGTEDKDLTGSSEYSESVTITEDPVKLSVSFVKDKAETKEETKKETKEEPAETEQTSGKIYTDTEGNTYTDPMLYYYGQSAIYAGQTGTSAASPRRMARRAAVKAPANAVAAGGSVYIDKYLAVPSGSVVQNLKSHENDTFYLTTPYSADLLDNWRLCGNYNGCPYEPKGMNCAGFVASVFIQLKSDLGSKILDCYPDSQYEGLHTYFCATNWQETMTDHANVIYYKFNTIADAINSGVMKKGDIIYIAPDWTKRDLQPDDHIGFYWGDASNRDKFWHSSHDTNGLTTYAGFVNGNHISPVTAKDDNNVAAVYVFPLSPVPNDPTSIQLTKASSLDENVKIADAEFELRYFENQDGNVSGTPKNTWTYKTDANGRIFFVNPSYKVSGDALEVKDGRAIFHVGTYAIRETNAPEGYKAPEGDLYIYTVTEDPGTGAVKLTEVAGSNFVKNTAQFAATVLEPPTEDISTMAVDRQTGTHTAALGETVFVDTVSYTGLVVGKEYTLNAKLMNKDTKEPVKVDGKEITGSVTFTPETKDGSIDVELPINTETLAGTRTVVFERLTLDGVLKAHHEEIDDKDQEVNMPPLKTNATDKNTGTHTAVAGKTTIVDRVSYEDLQVGKEYTVTGTLHYTEDCTTADGTEHKAGDEVLDADGNKITNSVTFTAEEENGSVDVEFEVDTSLLAGESIVAFEDMYQNKILVATHSDINDEDQIWNVPNVKTSATDEQTKEKMAAYGQTTFVDIVSYEGLTPGDEYILNAKLMNAETGEPILVDGNEVTGTTTFTPEAKEGSVEVKLPIDTTTLGDVKTVVFEKLFVGETEVASHEDIKDEDQRVDIPGAETEAKDGITEDRAGTVGETSIVDEITYTNLVPGKEYTVTGDLHYTEDCTTADGTEHKAGDVLLDADGNEITKTETFTAEQADGVYEMTFEIDSTLLAGNSVVVFENIYYNGIRVASHEDIEAENQTVHYPEVATKATDKNTGIQEAAYGKTTFIDEVTYKNLVPGTEYTLNATLMDKATEKPVLVDGKEVTGTLTFTPEEADGVAEVEIPVDTKTIGGLDTVVFEKLLVAGNEVTNHEDIEDEGQKIQILKAKTEAEDGTTERNDGVVGTKATIIDTVSYEKLIVGREYTVKGTLHYKEDCTTLDGKTHKAGDTIVDAAGKEIVASTTFTAEQADGTLEMTFELDATLLAGQHVVVFEDVYDNGILVAEHADLNDKDQTVDYPGLKTKATINGNKTATKSASTVVTDTVSYKNLVPGQEYTVKGTLMDKNTGSAVETVTSPVTFKPEKADGTVQVTFQFDSSSLAGHKFVVFEELYTKDSKDKEIKVADHSDINDKAQTVTITNPPIGEWVPTGTSPVMPWLAGGVAAVVLAAVVLLLRRRKANK